MEPTSSACTVASLTCSQLALATTGIIIGIGIIYTMKSKSKKSSRFASITEPLSNVSEKISSVFKQNPQNNKANKHKEERLDNNFSLLLITTSEKLRGKIEVSKVLNGEYNQPVQLEIVKNLINTSRYFLIKDTENNILSVATTSDNLPDLEKDNLFILKITGQGKHNIATCETKLGLRDSITSETCKIEKVLHLLDASIAKEFIPTI